MEQWRQKLKEDPRLIVLGIAVVLILAVLIWALVSQRPLVPRKPVPGEEVRAEEPMISLFINETGEKKNLKAEEYLAGVVAAEMEPTWPVEALAAQAILARTFTMQKIENEGGVPQHGTDASTSVEEFQAYAPERINDNVRRAVEKTRGEVVKYGDRYVRAWFHADAGGRTALAEEGLAFTKEDTPYLKSVEDPGQEAGPPEIRNWRAEFSLDAVRNAVQEATGRDPGDIVKLEIIRTGPSGRVVTFRVNDVNISGPALRLALGSEEMRSTLISDLKLENNRLLMEGSGYGHGVGMSQWGANVLARRGKSPEDIVRYYFKDVRIIQIWK